MNENRNNTGLIIGAIVIILLIAGGIYWYHNHSAAPVAVVPVNYGTSTTTGGTPVTGTTGSNVSLGISTGLNSTSSVPLQATVTYGANGFSPKTVTIAKGGTVNFVNQTGGAMWVASDPHPVHNGYDGTTRDQHCAAGYAGPAPFDQCAAGNSFSFTFNKTGTWGYHNHAGTENGGTVIVQ